MSSKRLVAGDAFIFLRWLYCLKNYFSMVFFLVEIFLWFMWPQNPSITDVCNTGAKMGNFVLVLDEL